MQVRKKIRTRLEAERPLRRLIFSVLQGMTKDWYKGLVEGLEREIWELLTVENRGVCGFTGLDWLYNRHILFQRGACHGQLSSQEAKGVPWTWLQPWTSEQWAMRAWAAEYNHSLPSRYLKCSIMALLLIPFFPLNCQLCFSFIIFKNNTYFQR